MLLSDLLLVDVRQSLCLVLILCIAELDLKPSMFLTTNVGNGNIYWEYSGRIFNFLNNG